MDRETRLREGLVVAKEKGNQVKVTILDISSPDCKNCHHNHKSKPNSFQVTARDPCNVSVGDRVQVELTPRSFGKVSAIVFGIPASSLLIGLGLGTLLSNLVCGGKYGHPLQGGLAGFLFLLSLVFLVIYDRHLSRQDRDTAVIKQLIDT